MSQQQTFGAGGGGGGGLTGSVTTTQLETKTILTISTLLNSVTTVEARIAAYGTPDPGPGVDGGLGGNMVACFITGLVATQLIDPPDVFQQSFLSPTATFTAVPSGTDILIQVTGDASHDINWTCTAYVTRAT